MFLLILGLSRYSLVFVFNVKLLSFKRDYFLSYRSLMYFSCHEGCFFFSSNSEF